MMFLGRDELGVWQNHPFKEAHSVKFHHLIVLGVDQIRFSNLHLVQGENGLVLNVTHMAHLRTCICVHIHI